MIPHILFKAYNAVDVCVMKVSKEDVDSVAHIAALAPYVPFMKESKKTGWQLPAQPGLFMLIYGSRRYDKFGPILRTDRHGFKAMMNSWCSRLRQRNVKCMPESRETLVLKFLEVHGKDLAPEMYARYEAQSDPTAASSTLS